MGRDSRIDTFRGLALVFMTGAHVPFASQEFFIGHLGFASFTQVFFFLSGLVAGIVYPRRIEQQSRSELRRSVSRRVATVWLAHILTFAVLLLAVHLGRALGSTYVPHNGGLLLEDPIGALLLGGAFLYMPAYMDILPLYFFFAALVPLAVRAMLRGHTGWVLLVSLLVWLTAQFGMEDRAMAALGRHVPTHPFSFRLTACQLIFVGGLAIGVAWSRGLLTRVRIGPGLAIAMLAVHSFLTLVRHGVVPDGALTEFIGNYSSNGLQGPIRLIDFALVVCLAAWLSKFAPSLMSWRWLALLGRHSLSVFAFHLIVVYALAFLGDIGTRDQLLLTTAAIASLTLPAWIAERRRA